MPQPLPLHVAKFGGTSVGSAERIQRVVPLVQAMPEGVRPVVVVSALGGLTDQLIAALEAAAARTGEHEALLDHIRERHFDVLNAVVSEDEHYGIRAQLESHLQTLHDLLGGIYLLREATPRTRDALIGLGELMNAPLVAATFRASGVEAAAVDARMLIRTDDTFGEANVDFDTTNHLVADWWREFPEDTIPIVTGFIATTEESVATTLGRSGSDYTATILGAALDAEEVVIWTDVDGVLSADPRIVPEAFSLPRLNYREAGELAYFGAKVLHPRTMRPLAEKNIPLVIKNTFRPEAPGTRITAETATAEDAIKAVTSARGLALVVIEGTGVMEAPDLLAHAFEALSDRQIPVLMVSQASSEQSLCFVVRESDRVLTVKTLDKALEIEKARGRIQGITVLPEVAIISVVGDGMRYWPGLAGQMFAALGSCDVNVLAISEGASETNIAAVILDKDAPTAVRVLHEAFPLRRTRAHIVVVGTGTIGQELLPLLAAQAEGLMETDRLHLRLVGLANTRQMVFDETGLSPDDALERLENEGQPADLDALVQMLVEAKLERLIVVDATASEDVARRYPELLNAGVAVVTPNKTANTLDYDFYQRLLKSARHLRTPYLYETTVGAGLSVISTLRDLVRTGDRVHRIEGVLSGTLSFVFNKMRDGMAFSEAVMEARRRGLTEPDPRADLSGADVANKLLILARELGLPAQDDDVEAESLVPPELQTVPLATFFEKLPKYDRVWQVRLSEHGGPLQYVSSLSEGRIRCGVQHVPADSPFGGLDGASLLLAFHTERYGDQPLVLRGPGANVAVTTAVLLADVVRAALLMK